MLTCAAHCVADCSSSLKSWPNTILLSIIFIILSNHTLKHLFFPLECFHSSDNILDHLFIVCHFNLTIGSWEKVLYLFYLLMYSLAPSIVTDAL